MMRRLADKLEGWPAALIGFAVLAAAGFYAHQGYARLEAGRLEALRALSAERERSYELLKTLSEKEVKLSEFADKVDDLSSAVDTLETLTQTDPELLKKYSKVYFLNENYSPGGLVEIDRPYVLPQATNRLFLIRAYPYLEKMIKSARDDGVSLLVASAYRSFDTQAALKNGYTVTYGSGANKFSADQGYSEHQLGTAADFTSAKLGANFNGFAKDPAYQWMLKNAYRYGFILSYPEGNAYYVYEPWHWRFVGVALATRLHDEGKNFYDLDQREIDDYLVRLFE
jgi:D-alanyl-D-alanine carboxypeptidase